MRPIDADALIEFCAERWIPLNIDAVNMQPTIQQEKAQLSKEGTTSDTISRQAAIDAIEKMNIPEDMCVFEILSHIEVEIATLPTIQPEVLACGNGELVAKPEPQWIPVSERLPETTDPVLTTHIVNGDRSRKYVEESAYYKNDEYWCSPWDEYRKEGTRIEVIAWMPEPEPYKGGEKDG